MSLAANVTLRALRPILFFVIFVFVLLPLVIYNVFTLEYYTSKAAGGSSPSSASSILFRGTPDEQQQQQQKLLQLVERLPPCLNVSSAVLLSSSGRAAIKAQCMANDTAAPASATAPQPYLDTVVHFIHVPLDAVPLLEGEDDPLPQVEKEKFTFLQFAAVQSIRKAITPKVMVLHYIDKEPRGVWYTQCQRHLSLHKVIAPKVTTSKGTSSLNIYQRRQLMEFLLMLRVLHKQGGIAFSDFNTFMLRDTLRQVHDFGVVAGQAPSALTGSSGGTVFQVGVHTLQATAKHTFIKYLQDNLADLIARDDPKLHLLTLEQLVGHITLGKYLFNEEEKTTSNSAAEGASDMVRDVVVGSSGLFEGIPLPKVPRFLSATVGDPSAMHFQGVSGFHLDKYDFRARSTAAEGVQQLETLQQKIVAAEDILDGKSLFEAVLRFVTALNTTAELEPHFTGNL